MALTAEIRLDSFKDAAAQISAGASPAESLSVDAAPTSFFDNLVDAFTKPAQGAAEQTANVDAAPNRNQNADLGIKQAASWKPEIKLNNNVVAKGVEQSRNTANAMGADAKAGLASIAEVEKDMKEQAAPDAKAAGVGSASLTGMGRGMLFDAAVVGVAGLVAGPGAAAALGGVSMARDMMKAVAGGGSSDPRMSDSPSPKTVSVSKRDLKRGNVPDEVRKTQYGPSNSFEAQARKAEAGYSRAPVASAMFDKLSQGPGFGLTSDERAELGPRSALAHDSLTDGNFEQIKLAKAGFENQLHTARDLKDGLDARANNGVAVTNAADLGDVHADNLPMNATQKAALIPGMMA